MNNLSYHSGHGRNQHIERFRMPMRKLCNVLNRGGFHTIKQEQFFQKEYRLTYSPEDGKHMVVVQSTYTGKIITVLPVRFYETMHSQIPQSDLDMARQKFDCANRVINTPPTKGSFYVAVQITVHGKPKSKQIGVINAEAYDYDYKRLAADNEFPAMLQEWCIDNAIDIDHINWISIKLGQKSTDYGVFYWKDSKVVSE